MLRFDARKIEALEEYPHNVQSQIGLTDELSPWQLEIHVKQFMLKHRKLLGISDGASPWLEDWLASAEGY